MHGLRGMGTCTCTYMYTHVRDWSSKLSYEGGGKSRLPFVEICYLCTTIVLRCTLIMCEGLVQNPYEVVQWSPFMAKDCMGTCALECHVYIYQCAMSSPVCLIQALCEEKIVFEG